MISFLKTFLTIFTSLALHTIASNLALEASLACCKTTFLTSLLKPIPLSALSSKEVRIVTPTNFILPDIFFAALRASKPELTCIVK